MSKIFKDDLGAVKGELEILRHRYRNGRFDTEVVNKGPNLVVNLAGRIMSRIIAGNAGLPDSTFVWGGSTITISSLSELFVNYMKWSYDSANTDPQLTDEDLDGSIITDGSGTEEVSLLPVYPTSSSRSVGFRACIGTIPASLTDLNTLLVSAGTTINQEGIYSPGPSSSQRLLFAKRLFNPIEIDIDEVFEFRHTIIF